jgi:acetylornithine deacetylase/succinyl-diaminopimelate desuccinylase-like protein
MPHVMPSFVTDPGDPMVVAAARALEAVKGEPAPVRPWLFATDGGHLAEAGARVIGYGPGPQERAHIVDESLSLEELRLGFEGTLACVLAMDEALHADG